ncbi:hypothetical protein BH23ACT4_BH23ACT4_07980 [soil metagenome]
MSRRTLTWVTLAFTASVWHLLIDGQIGLLGPTSETMTLLQGTTLLLEAALIGAWLYLIPGAATGKQGPLGALALLVLLEPVLFDGAVALLVAPPPAAAFPYQDIAHLSSLAFGIIALLAMRRDTGWGTWGRESWFVLILKIAGSVTGSIVFFTLGG